jgi:hypothetical protein
LRKIIQRKYGKQLISIILHFNFFSAVSKSALIFAFCDINVEFLQIFYLLLKFALVANFANP